MWLKNGRNALVVGGSHFFFKLSISILYVSMWKLGQFLIFFKNLVLEIINLVLNIFKYKLKSGSHSF
jgi:hypothetical protein